MLHGGAESRGIRSTQALVSGQDGLETIMSHYEDMPCSGDETEIAMRDDLDREIMRHLEDVPVARMLLVSSVIVVLLRSSGFHRSIIRPSESVVSWSSIVCWSCTL